MDSGHLTRCESCFERAIRSQKYRYFNQQPTPPPTVINHKHLETPSPLFNFPYPSCCLPYFPFPPLLAGNTTTVFDFSLPFPCNPFPYSPLHVTPLISFLYPSRYHTSPTFPFRRSSLVARLLYSNSLTLPLPSLPLLLPTLVRGRS